MPSTLSNMLMAIPLIVGGHSLGHVRAGDEKGYNIQINPSTFSEEVLPKISYSRGRVTSEMPNSPDRTFIENGGFVGQDGIASLLGDDSRLVNAIYKLGYLADIPKKINGYPGDFGRIEEFKDKTAKRVMKGAVALTAISDMLKAFGHGLPDNQDLRVWSSDTGAPGLMYTRRF